MSSDRGNESGSESGGSLSSGSSGSGSSNSGSPHGELSPTPPLNETYYPLVPGRPSPKSNLDVLPPEVLQSIIDEAFPDRVEKPDYDPRHDPFEDKARAAIERMVADGRYPQEVRALAFRRLRSIVWPTFSVWPTRALRDIDEVKADVCASRTVARLARVVVLDNQHFRKAVLSGEEGLGEQAGHFGVIGEDGGVDVDWGSEEEDEVVLEDDSYDMVARRRNQRLVICSLFDLLINLPNVQYLHCTSTGLASLTDLEFDPDDDREYNMEEDQDCLLPNLQHLTLQSKRGYDAEDRKLDIDGALLTHSLFIQTLKLVYFVRVYDSNPNPDRMRPYDRPAAHRNLRNLELKNCYMSLHCLQRAIRLAGPLLQNVTIDVHRGTCRPSSEQNARFLTNPMQSHDDPGFVNNSFTCYDVLHTLRPWQATSLRTLTLRRVFHTGSAPGPGRRVDEKEDFAIMHRKYDSSLRLLPGFTALHTLRISIDLLDWRQVWQWSDSTDMPAIRTVADDIAANFPPNLVSLEILDVDYHDTLSEPYYAEPDENDDVFGLSLLVDATLSGWWPRRQALALAVVAAIRNGLYPSLTSIGFPITKHPDSAVAVQNVEFLVGNPPRTVAIESHMAHAILVLPEYDKSTLVRGNM